MKIREFKPIILLPVLVFSLIVFGAPMAHAGAAASGGTLRIICFGAHPDDCELQAGGTAALWAAKGHKVKFVSVTNGDIGHWRDAGGPLARRDHRGGTIQKVRTIRAKKAA